MWSKRLNVQSRQIRKFCRRTPWLNSDAQLKDSLVFTFSRFREVCTSPVIRNKHLVK